MEVQYQIGKNDGVIVAGEVEESKEIEAETIDIEDVQPQQIMPTPDLPSRAVIEEHRIDHWPRGPGVTNAMKAIDENVDMAKSQFSTELL